MARVPSTTMHGACAIAAGLACATLAATLVAARPGPRQLGAGSSGHASANGTVDVCDVLGRWAAEAAVPDGLGGDLAGLDWMESACRSAPLPLRCVEPLFSDWEMGSVGDRHKLRAGLVRLSFTAFVHFHVSLFVFISGTMRFSRYGLGASSPLITTPQYQR
jgi:hypothetical protein